VESGGVRIVLVAFSAKWISGDAKAIQCKDFRWVKPDELSGFTWARADLPIVEKMLKINKRHA
jgi:hypothetical protein